MSETVELDDDLAEKINRHRAEGESYEEFIEAVVNHYVSEGESLWEGYGGPP